MATFSGEGGSLKFDLTTAATVAQVKTWSLNIQKTELDTTFLGSDWKTAMGSLAGATGSCQVAYDSVNNSGTDKFMEAVLVANDQGVHEIELYTTSDKKITGTCLITGFNISSQVENLIMADVSFRLNSCDASGLHTDGA